GKGGEKIRELQRQCGAHIEINKATQNNPHERLFNVRGTQVQVNHAQMLIRQVVENSPGMSSTPTANTNQPPIQPYPQIAGYPPAAHSSSVYPPYQMTPQPAATPWPSYPFQYPSQQTVPGQ
uniref:KH domain-containing protein n=1 Tax=Salmonella sp. s51228 TaxID=3159652 RepID=UPI003980D657